ncbi:SET domain-containing protein [Neocallimastix lanati (nom. inval.)]|uniref:SET domain-containing protein n=1 Tax=Neocallimastix californiae TaxID=1754190 RepID=A0A1Y2F4L1_9FUNG|nr:SET domain-containing protein [Neocallimastix sp. JGI-2020a]ORY78801.1 SET domain-containing protein [Neocallimastix californiae]|eukprot:ORY78801.1 SET domain-containing protein [Neocallimastix californiae]
MDYTTIRNINEKLVIRKSKSKRRKVTARINLKKGTLLMTENALASNIEKEYLDKYCNYCYQNKKTKLYRCAGCRSSYYCSKECQKKAYKYHKSECKFIKEHPQSAINHCRLMNQILLKINEDSKIEQTFNELIDHKQEYLDNNKGEISDDMKEYASAEKFFSGYQGSLDSFIDKIIKVNCNVLGIFDGYLNYYASGLFLQFSNINHDCNPNCTIYFRGNTVYLKALRDIKQDEEITINYCSVYDTCRMRQTYLKNIYYFTCECPRCIEYKDQLYLDPSEGIKCQTEGCDGYISHVEFNACPKCGKKLSPEIEENVKSIINKIDHLPESMSIEEQEFLLKDMLREQRTYFHPKNYYIYQNLENQRHLQSLQKPPYSNSNVKDDSVSEFYGRRATVDYELYQYCTMMDTAKDETSFISTSTSISHPSSYKTILMAELLNNALTEILEYQEVHQMEMNDFMAYAQQKLEAIHYREVRQQLESELLLTFDDRSEVYTYTQDLFERFRLYLLM